MSEEPRVVREDEAVWLVTGDPKPCLCGHEHYPRLPMPNARSISIWWGYCEDPGCSCNRLHTQYLPRTSQAASG